MGEITKKVIVELLKNSRRAVSSIAKTPYLTRDIVSYQMQKLEKEGVIKAYTAQIQQHYFCQGVAHVQCKLKKVTQQTIELSIEYLQEHESVNWIGSVCGSADIVFTFLYTSVVNMQDTLSEITTQIGTKEHSLSLYTQELKFDRKGIFDGRAQVKPQNLPQFIPQEIKLDSADSTILRHLANNARVANRKLAQETELSEDAVRYRIKNLEQKGIVTGYTTILDTKKLGFEGYMVYLQAEVSKQMMQSFVQKQPLIVFCAQMSGSYNFTISILVNNRSEFTSVLQELRNTFSENITGYEVLLLLDEHKEMYIPSAILTQR